MEYLVQKADGGYYISNIDPCLITKEKNGKSDKILLEWEEEERKESLDAFFSGIKKDSKTITEEIISGVNTQDIITSILTDYQLDESAIVSLYCNKSIKLKEKLSLLKKNAKAKKKQFNIIQKVYDNNKVISKTYTLK